LFGFENFGREGNPAMINRAGLLDDENVIVQLACPIETPARPSEFDANHRLVHGNVSSMVGRAEHEQILFERGRSCKSFSRRSVARKWLWLPEIAATDDYGMPET